LATKHDTFLAILFKPGNPNPNPRTISPDPLGFPLGTSWAHIGNKGKNKKSLSTHPLEKKKPGVFSKEFVTIFGLG
jgi:hypothetical protein